MKRPTALERAVAAAVGETALDEIVALHATGLYGTTMDATITTLLLDGLRAGAAWRRQVEL